MLLSVRRKIEGSLVQNSPEALRLLFEQATLFSAYNWFNPGNQDIRPDMTEFSEKLMTGM